MLVFDKRQAGINGEDGSIAPEVSIYWVPVSLAHHSPLGASDRTQWCFSGVRGVGSQPRGARGARCFGWIGPTPLGFVVVAALKAGEFVRGTCSLYSALVREPGPGSVLIGTRFFRAELGAQDREERRPRILAMLTCGCRFRGWGGSNPRLWHLGLDF